MCPDTFFNLRNERDVQDDEGSDLADLGAARDHAVADIRELMKEEVKKGRINLTHRIEVADERGRPVLRVPFLEAVTVTG